MANHTVLILGAGYAGLGAVLRLNKLMRESWHLRGVDLVLVDEFDYHQLITRLHEVAAASIEPEAAAIPLGRLLRHSRIDYLQGRVSKVDMSRGAVMIDGQSVLFDHLVFALGSETDFFGIPGIREHSLTLKSISDAKWVRSHIRRMIAWGCGEADPELRRAMLTFVVGGGGFTGVELAGELADWLPELAAGYGLDPSEIRLVCVEAGGTLLSGFDPQLARTAREVLEKKNVEVRLESAVVEGTESTVKLASGQIIPTKTVVWTGGVRGNPLLNQAGISTGAKNRAVTNGYLESVDFPGVYVAGDSCLALDPRTKRPVAQSAQMAIEEANTVAGNICADLTGDKRVAFEPKTLGEIVSLGRRHALANLVGLSVVGYPGKLLKDMTQLHYISGVGGWRLALQRFPSTVGELVSQRASVQED